MPTEALALCAQPRTEARPGDAFRAYPPPGLPLAQGGVPAHRLHRLACPDRGRPITSSRRASMPAACAPRSDRRGNVLPMRSTEPLLPQNAARPRAVAPLAWVGALALIALHNDAWLQDWLPGALSREARTELWFGGLPGELGYRLGWMLLAWLYLAWFCRVIWVSPGEEPA